MFSLVTVEFFIEYVTVCPSPSGNRRFPRNDELTRNKEPLKSRYRVKLTLWKEVHALNALTR